MDRHRLLKAGLASTVAVSVVFLLVSATGVGVSAVGNAAPGLVSNAILISWDGVQRSLLRELLDAGRLPNLQALAGEGAIVEIDVTHKTDPWGSQEIGKHRKRAYIAIVSAGHHPSQRALPARRVELSVRARRAVRAPRR